jgi:hypothetical protein
VAIAVAVAVAVALGVDPVPWLDPAAPIVTRAEAHRGASRTTRLYRERSLLCARAPVEHVLCVGPQRGKAHLLAQLAAALTRDPRVHLDRARDAAVAAAYFDVREAIGPLRALLALRPDPAALGRGDGWARQGLRAEAAFALAHLGDAASAPAIAELVAELEVRGQGSLWLDTLAALAAIAPAAASRYAIAFLGRAGDLRTSMPGGSPKLAALDFVLASDRAAALPVLARLSRAEERGYARAHCLLMAARVRLDPGVRAAARRLLAGSYGGTWLAECVGDVIAALGDDPADAPALVRHLGRPDRGAALGDASVADTRVLALVQALSARAPGEPPARERARGELRRALAERSRSLHVADARPAGSQLHGAVLHHAALAGLGDAAARARLEAILDDPADPSGAAWLAAEWALRLRLPGAAARTRALIERGVRAGHPDRRGPRSGGARARVLAAFAEHHPDDDGWTPLLLDPDVSSDAAEQALFRIARRPPPETCRAVVGAARAARPEAVELAFLALTALGDACRPALEAVLDDAGAPPAVRGTALELLAALGGSPALCARIAAAEATSPTGPAPELPRAARQRARLLLGAACDPPRAP